MTLWRKWICQTLLTSRSFRCNSRRCPLNARGRWPRSWSSCRPSPTTGSSSKIYWNKSAWVRAFRRRAKTSTTANIWSITKLYLKPEKWPTSVPISKCRAFWARWGVFGKSSSYFAASLCAQLLRRWCTFEWRTRYSRSNLMARLSMTTATQARQSPLIWTPRAKGARLTAKTPLPWSTSTRLRRSSSRWIWGR